MDPGWDLCSGLGLGRDPIGFNRYENENPRSNERGFFV